MSVVVIRPVISQLYPLMDSGFKINFVANRSHEILICDIDQYILIYDNHTSYRKLCYYKRHEDVL